MPSTSAMTVTSNSGRITPLYVTAIANPTSVILGQTIPTLSGEFYTTGDRNALNNFIAKWTAIGNTSKAGSYFIEPSNITYINGSEASDFVFTNVLNNANVLTIINPIPKNPAYMPFVATSVVYMTQSDYNANGVVGTQGIANGINGEANMIQSSLDSIFTQTNTNFNSGSIDSNSNNSYIKK